MKNQLRQLAMTVAKKAHAPYSKAQVGAAILTTDGQIYCGCNIENARYGGTVCAERVAIFKAVSEQKLEIKTLYVYTDAGWPPCGFCRQVISEFASKEMLVIIGDKHKNEKEILFSDLLPYQFGSEHLNK